MAHTSDFDGFDLEPVSTENAVVISAGSEVATPPEEMEVSLEITTSDDGQHAFVYGHGDVNADNGTLEKVRQTVLIARVTPAELVMYPVVSASYRDEFLEPRHGELTTIRIPAHRWEYEIPTDINEFDELLAGLPVGFSRHAKLGLGLKWEYRLIPESITERSAVNELLLVEGEEASIVGNVYRLGKARLERLRRALDTIARRAQRRSLEERRMLAFNEIMHAADSAIFPKKYRQPQAGEIYELAQLSSRAPRRNQDDRSAVADLVVADAPAMVRENPAALMELHSEIERITLGEFISRFEQLMSRDPNENAWQRFFESHPFILGIALPYPVRLIRGQAHVGGTTIDGTGGSIADFLFSQQLTGGLAIIEIKTTTTPLVESRPFRGDLYGPNKLLCAAISQALDQRSQLIMNFATRQSNPGMTESHVGHVHCIVIAGRTPTDANQKRSLDLFRNASKDVSVLTFDELLEKLRSIYRLLTPSSTSAQATAADPQSFSPVSAL
jgi:hypothetical protein